MYTSKGIEELMTKEQILAKVSEEEIFRHYLGFDFETKKMYISLLRNDSIPSLNLYYNSRGEIRYKDFGHSQGSCFDYVMNVYGVSYREALKLIVRDLRLGTRPVMYQQFKRKIRQSNVILEVTAREFSEDDIKYWNSYGISKPTLDKYKVYATQYVWLNGKLVWLHDPNNPIYTYLFPNSGKKKCYRPLETKYKWLCNTSSYDIQGLDQLPDTGNVLIITKAMKDVMLFHELGLPAIAPQGEGMHIPSIVTDHLHTRFNTLITVYDNDEPGVRASIKLNDSLGSTYWNIPKKYKEKDITDFYKAYGREKTLELIKPLIERNEIDNGNK